MVIGPSLLLAFRSTVGDKIWTLTITESAALPPEPVQVIVYVLLVIKLPVDSDPDKAFDPDQLPEAEQEVVLVEAQDRVAAVL